MRDDVERQHNASRIEFLNAKLHILCGSMVDALEQVYVGNTTEAAKRLEAALEGVLRFLHSETEESRTLAEDVLAILHGREQSSQEFMRFVQELKRANPAIL